MSITAIKCTSFFCSIKQDSHIVQQESTPCFFISISHRIQYAAYAEDTVHHKLCMMVVLCFDLLLQFFFCCRYCFFSFIPFNRLMHQFLVLVFDSHLINAFTSHRDDVIFIANRCNKCWRLFVCVCVCAWVSFFLHFKLDSMRCQENGFLECSFTRRFCLNIFSTRGNCMTYAAQASEAPYAHLQYQQYKNVSFKAIVCATNIEVDQVCEQRKKNQFHSKDSIEREENPRTRLIRQFIVVS